MNATDIARTKRLHTALTQRRAVLMSELVDAEKRFERLQRNEVRDPALAGPDSQRAQLERIETLRRQLTQHDEQAKAKLETRIPR